MSVHTECVSYWCSTLRLWIEYKIDVFKFITKFCRRKQLGTETYKNYNLASLGAEQNFLSELRN